MRPYLEEKEDVLAQAGSSMEGLSEEEAARRLAKDGPNKLREAEKERLILKFLKELKDPMTIVLIIAALTVLSYFVGHRMESGAWAIAQSPDGMTMAFLTLSMIEIFHAFNMRSRTASLFGIKRQNKWLWGTLAFSLLITAAVIFIPFLNKAFSFTPITLTEYGTAMALALMVIPVVEIQKAVQRGVARKNAER